MDADGEQVRIRLPYEIGVESSRSLFSRLHLGDAKRGDGDISPFDFKGGQGSAQAVPKIQLHASLNLLRPLGLRRPSALEKGNSAEPLAPRDERRHTAHYIDRNA